MLMDTLRDGAQSRVAKVIFSLIIVSFGLAGVGSYLNRPSSNDPAEVDGEKITAQELERNYQNERNSIQNQYGEAASQLFENPQYLEQLKRSVLDRLINQALIEHKIQKSGIRLNDEQVKDAIRTLPEFQTNGAFDNQKFLAILGRVGYTPEAFANSMRADLAKQLWVDNVVKSEFLLSEEKTDLANLYNQVRDITLYRLPASQFQSTVKYTDADLQKYYQSHEQLFKHPELVKLNYVVLNASELESTVQPTEQELKAYYDSHQDSFAAPAKIKVAHILISGKDDAVNKAKAESLLADIQKGADFATLAKKDSADTLSAKNGGELDWFEKGVMDPAFEKAAFALQSKGALSGVVKSSFGYHVIKLLDKQDAKAKAFDDVKETVKQKLVKDKAREMFADLQQKMSDTGFENPDALDTVAEAIHSKIKTTDFIASNQLPEEINAPAVKTAAFQQKLRDENTNSEVLSVSDSSVVMLHVADYKPAAVKPFDEVKAQVTQLYSAEQASQIASSNAEKLLNALQAKQDIQGLMQQFNIKKESKAAVKRFDSTLSPKLNDAVFELPKTGKDLSASIINDGNDAVVLVLNHVGNADAKNAIPADALAGQALQVKQQQVYQSVLGQLKEKATIKYLLKDKPVTE